MKASLGSQTQTATTSQLQKPKLRWGCTGLAVVELQRLLAYWGTYNGDFEGIFDTPVENGVKAFQNRVFLPETGIVEQTTWLSLYTGAPVNMPQLRLGSQGEKVCTLQRVLVLTGDYTDKVDGIFGAKTEVAVRAFQKRCGLVIDGIVAFHTWHALSKVPH